MSFERSYSIESHERIKLILVFADKSLLLKWWVTYVLYSTLLRLYETTVIFVSKGETMRMCTKKLAGWIEGNSGLRLKNMVFVRVSVSTDLFVLESKDCKS